MNDRFHDSNTEKGGDIGQLIRRAGARDAVPDDRLERSRGRVRAHWQEVVETRRAERHAPRWVPLAAAAGVLVVAGLVALLPGRFTSQESTALASVERIVGELRIDGRPAGSSMELQAGAVLETGPDDLAALRLAGGQSLRLDAGSRVTLASPARLLLDSGALYIDTDTAVTEATVRVETPLGTARDIGTQFQVRLLPASLVVSVRHGIVEVGPTGGGGRAVNAGYRVAFRDASEPAVESLDTEDPDWRWIDEVTPVFDIDGASLAEFLDWYAKEAGLELVWADAASQNRAQRTTLTGSIEGVDLHDSLDVVRQVAPFDSEVTAGHLKVRVR